MNNEKKKQSTFYNLIRDEYTHALLCTLFAALVIYLLLIWLLGYNLWEHSPYDSYTLQAMAWRNGSLSLSQNYEWLELAIYDGKYFVSFPPFPTVIMLVLTFFFGEATPSVVVDMFFYIGSTGVAYAIIRRFGWKPYETALASLFLTAGCNMLDISIRGGVWHIAQGASFFFTLVCVWAMETPAGKFSFGRMIVGPLCIAIAVGCRPFQAIYVPYVLFRLYEQCRGYYFKDRDKLSFLGVIRKMIPFVTLPFFIAVAYAVLNYLRFGNIFEFGHNYLPEFSTEGGVQFSTGHWLGNLKNIVRFPSFQDNRLVFPKASGFAFYLCNPMFAVGIIEFVRRVVKRQMDTKAILLVVSIFIHFNLLLLHRTFGGWQWGTRYLIDIIPVLALFAFFKKKGLSFADQILIIWGIGFNFYGPIVHELF